MNNLFFGCKSLTSLPDISNWDTGEVEIMSNLFYGCFSIKSIPNISEWNTSKVKTIAHMFCNCESLELLPDISRWDISNVKNEKIKLYANNSPITKEIPKWNIYDIIYIDEVVDGCINCVNIPSH